MATAFPVFLPDAAPYLIKQEYADYTAQQHAVWAEPVRRRMTQFEENAAEYLGGFELIDLAHDRLPGLAAISHRLATALPPPRHSAAMPLLLPRRSSA
jgi:phenylalanine-4-hydroxylase